MEPPSASGKKNKETENDPKESILETIVDFSDNDFNGR